MKGRNQNTLQPSEPNGNITDNKNLNSEIIIKEKCEDFNIIENTITGDIAVAMGNVMLKKVTRK